MRSTQCDWEEVDLTLLFSSPSLGGLSCLASEVHSWCLFYNMSINQHIMFSCLLGVSCEFQKQVKETQLRFVFQPTEEVSFLIYLEIPELGWPRYMENQGPVHSPPFLPPPPAHSLTLALSFDWLSGSVPSPVRPSTPSHILAVGVFKSWDSPGMCATYQSLTRLWWRGSEVIIF